jgi:hypothetical protein
MREKHHLVECGPDKCMVASNPVRETDVELTPRAEAKAANRLPRTEQMKKFEQDLAARDSGNQPA